MIKLGKTFRYVRHRKGLSQRKAAEQLGISNVYLCNLESDTRSPSGKLLATIRKTWNVDLYILAWCLHGDLASLPSGVRSTMKELGRQWKQDLEKKGMIN